MWGSIALLILQVYDRVQTSEYAAVLTYHQLFSTLNEIIQQVLYLNLIPHVS